VERKSRCLQRLLITATFRWQILLGHFIAILIMIFTVPDPDPVWAACFEG
jgi:ABC-type transport system involved in multi-copper enzyme maturation permease subunit